MLKSLGLSELLHYIVAATLFSQLRYIQLKNTTYSDEKLHQLV